MIFYDSVSDFFCYPPRRHKGTKKQERLDFEVYNYTFKICKLLLQILCSLSPKLLNYYLTSVTIPWKFLMMASLSVV